VRDLTTSRLTYYVKIITINFSIAFDLAIYAVPIIGLSTRDKATFAAFAFVEK